MKPSTEHLEFWANVGDNRLGPLFRELLLEAADSEPEAMRRLAKRLRFAASSLQSYADKVEGK